MVRHKRLLKKIIYDFGANNGSDIPYYMLKADLVVAVEANPELCNELIAKYSKEVSEGRLIVENCVLSTAEQEKVEFFIPMRGLPGLSDHHSTFADPDTLKEPFRGRHKYNTIHLRSKTPASIVSRHGKPYYIKVDVEHYDRHILRNLFQSQIFPRYISAESHSITILAELIATGKYDMFKLVEGHSVSEVYDNRLFDIRKKRMLKDRHPTLAGQASGLFTNDSEKQAVIRFPIGSSGPFGDDIDGEWLTPDGLFQKLQASGLGWKDIHAKRTRKRQQTYQITPFPEPIS